jgi:hypothetical protein
MKDGAQSRRSLDLVDESSLERALRRAGLTEAKLAERLGLGLQSFVCGLAEGRVGLREQIENVLRLPAGSLRWGPFRVQVGDGAPGFDG